MGVQKHKQKNDDRCCQENHREVHDICQDVKEIEISAEEYDTVRPKVFNFHSMQSVIVVKLETK